MCGFSKQVDVIVILSCLSTKGNAYAGWSYSHSIVGTSGQGGFSDVWGTSATDVFAVGCEIYSPDGFDVMCINAVHHYDGTEWTDMDVYPGNNEHSSLMGIWGSSSTDVFAVGTSGRIYHYNGTSWTSMQSGTEMMLYGVRGTSSADVFAVGNEFDEENGLYNSVVLHYDGNEWSEIYSESNKLLRDIWCLSPKDVFVVDGYYEEGSQSYKGVILHYDSSKWSSIDAENDIDADGICGDVDNCPHTANTDQVNSDNDTIGDVCDNCNNKKKLKFKIPKVIKIKCLSVD